MELPTESEPIRVAEGDALDVLPTLSGASADAVVTDPPYGLEFMGKEWDKFGGGKIGAPGIGDRATPWVSHRGWNDKRCRKCGHLTHGGSPCVCAEPDIRAADDRWRQFQAFNEAWATAVFRVLKPDGYALIFGGTRTYHRLICAIEDAGFEVRDCLMWLYGTGFPKGQACLKPAWEPILLARKPAPRVAPLNIDAARVPLGGEPPPSGSGDRRGGNIYAQDEWTKTQMANGGNVTPKSGRWPANLVHDGSPEVLAAFAEFGESDRPTAPPGRAARARRTGGKCRGVMNGTDRPAPSYPDTGTAARFFYCAKASRKERGEGNTHPTVKPVALMRWLVRLVTRPGDLVLDPFAGSGTTALACLAEGRRCLMAEREPAYCEIARRRVAEAQGQSVGSLFSGVPCEA